MSSRNRLFTALITTAALLFAQLAVSAYPCSMAFPDRPVMEGNCDEGGVNANLCERHCDYGNATFELAKPVHASPAVIVASLRVSPPDVALAQVRAPSPYVASGPAPPLPLSRFTVLRI